MWERDCCGEGACSRSTAQQSQAFGGASHPSASKLARHSKPAPTFDLRHPQPCIDSMIFKEQHKQVKS
ncbi:hypothetical protein DD985_02590 [Pseudomonas sp. HMWF011]|nr:hypothetical protein DBR14_19020 [Pseudomonas sp. HMWF034]PVV77795.1 hypothetical protein DD985_02590 [Pseudomonas sp. HMWF011]